jgi:Ca2+-transporting ATPase
MPVVLPEPAEFRHDLPMTRPDTARIAAWWTFSPEETLQKLGVRPAGGLNPDEAARRLAAHGPNALVERGIKSPWAILGEQLSGVLVLVLIAAAVVSAFLGETADAVVIGMIVVLNALLGLTQEYRAEKAMAALKRLAVPVVRVRRGGQVREISSREIVPGDVFLIEAGNLVPADARLIEAFNLRVQEAALTGESEPVEKHVRPLAAGTVALGDRLNMVHMGTIVTYGRGAAVVTATGMRTELGAVAALLQGVVREPTPLQKRLAELGRGLALAALALVAVLFVQGLIRGGLGADNLKLMFLTAISMAVAAVPEGLPAVVTIALALGGQRMLRRRALIRKLLAVETLGSVTVICSDKTGTLTENRMTVTVLDVAGDTVDVAEHLDHESVALESAPPHPLLADKPGFAMLLAAGALCNDAALRVPAAPGAPPVAIGDPTEGALVVAAAGFALPKDALERALPRVQEAPFDSERKRMTTVHAVSGPLPPVLARAVAGAQPPFLACCKGAVDGLLGVCGAVWSPAGAEALAPARRAAILEANNRLAAKGMRVLGLAWRPLERAIAGAEAERDLVFLGLIGMIDPPRAEVRDAVATCRSAGIRPVMITGDHPLTAAEIARQLGLAADGGLLTGVELEALAAHELRERVKTVSIYARVAPEHKLRIVEALQAEGHVVAMTGDGVNDAPALRKSDIGVAMGITGTDVSKEASDMVLQDDNFATIVAAVEEGRVIYDNIRKFVRYLLSTNSGELWTMLLAPFLGLPLPMLPIQILWMNLVTDGLPALALGVEPAERDIMRRPPRHTRTSIFSGGLGWHVLWVGLLMGVVSLGTAWWFAHTGGHDLSKPADETYFRTLVFTLLTFLQMAHVLAIRSERDSLFRIGLGSNRPLLAAVAITMVLQLALVYAPFLQGFFRTVPLTGRDLGLCLLLSSSVFWAVEAEKWIGRRRAARGAGA